MTKPKPGPVGRPRRYPENITPAERTAYRTAERCGQGWVRKCLWIPPGVDPEMVTAYVAELEKLKN